MAEGPDLKSAQYRFESDGGDQIKINLLLSESRVLVISRSFNKLEADPSLSYVRKSSVQTDKLQKEINFYSMAPDRIKSLMPKLLDSADDCSWYDMEYISGTPLGKEYIENSLAEPFWEKIFKDINSFLADYLDFSKSSSEEQLNKILVEKAITRSKEINDAEIKAIFFDGCTINGKPYLPLNSLLELSSEVLTRVPLDVGLLHGDICFSNILVRAEDGLVKFIDPRGGFDEPEIYGPIVYDIAKVAQSAVGGYEQLLYKKYSLIDKKDSYLLVLEKPVNYERVLPLFVDFLRHYEVSLSDAYKLAGLMLAGTPLLHMEDPARAKALALQSVLLLSGDVIWK